MINDVFERVVCLNLDRRPDRWEHAQKQFAAHGIKVERQAAVDGHTIPPRPGMVPGAAGCTASHIEALDSAVSDGVETLMIFEDDVVFDPRFVEKFDRIYPGIPHNWDIMYLGFNRIGIPQVRLLVPGAVQLAGALSTHAIGFKGVQTMKTLLTLARHSTEPIDVVYAREHVRYNVVGFDPVLAKQLEDYSDIENRVVNYDLHHGMFGD